MMQQFDHTLQDRIQYLRDNTDFVSAIFDCLVGYAIIAADFDGNIIAYNEGAHRIYGYPPEDIIGRESIGIFFPPEFIQKGKLDTVMTELVDQERVAYDGEKIKKDGSRFPAHVLLTLTKDKIGRIVGFVEMVQDLTERKKAEEDLRKIESNLRHIIESNADSIIVVDPKGRILFVNPAATKLFARPADELLNSYFGFPTIGGESTEIEILRPRNCAAATAEMLVVEIDWQGEKAFLASLRDITERKISENKLSASLFEKEILLKEIHHRVKNNLQIISSLLKLQAQHTMDKNVLEIFRNSQNRINSMVSIHAMLYQSENLSSINFGEYIRNTTDQLFRSYSVDTSAVALKVNAQEVMLTIDTAIPCGLIINELISNALKHAFPAGRKGEITVDMMMEGNHIRILFADNGIGFPAGLDFYNTKTLGLKLVNMLVKQLHGRIERTGTAGAKLEITIKAAY